MTVILKKIGLFLAAASLTVIIFVLFFLDRRAQVSAFESTLNLLGKKLVTMIPNEEDRTPVKEEFEKFVKNTREKKITPEQVEYITANILNLSNRDTVITPEQAQAVLHFSLAAPAIWGEKTGKLEQVAGSEKVLDRWREVSERVVRLNQANNELQKTIKRSKVPDAVQENIARIQIAVINDGLVFSVNPELKTKNLSAETGKVEKELERLEKEKLLVWQDTIKIKIADQIDKQQTEYLIKLKNLEHIQLNVNDVLKSIKVLQGLAPMPTLPKINMDSLQFMIKDLKIEAKVIADSIHRRSKK